MNPITVTLVAAGGILGALAVSANQRKGGGSLATARQPAAAPPLPRLPASTTLTIPSHAVDVTDDTADTAQPMARAPRVAAQALYDYVTQVVRDGRGAELGTAGKPNATVRAAQTDMKLLTADGIYGAKTRTRGKELLGREFPAREAKTRGQPLTSTAAAPTTPARTVVLAPNAAPAVVLEHAPAAEPPPPSQPVAAHTPRESAEALLIYVSAPQSDVGSKKKPNATVRAAQKAMGGLTADGIYGPKTRARIHTLTGKNPPR